MRYERLASFDKALWSLPSAERLRVLAALERLETGFERGQLTPGFGLKPLQHGFWEIRVGLADRIIFRRSGDVIVFVLVGTHDDIKRFLRHQ